MDPCLTQRVAVSLPIWRPYSRAPAIPGYSSISSITPCIEKLLGAPPLSEGQLQSDNLFAKVLDFEGSGSCSVETVGRKKKKAYCKVTHLLDPVRTMQSYYTHPEKGQRRRNDKLANPDNQAYVDCMANYLLGQLRERGISPHFCLFYGGFKGVADIYRYDITSSYESYRKYRAFWKKKNSGLFTLYVKDDEDRDILNTPASSLRSSAFSYSTSSTDSSDRSHISLLDESDISGATMVELESVSSFESASEEDTSDDDDDEDYEDEESDTSSINVYSEFTKHPVVLIFQEEMVGVLDSLLEDDSITEDKWIAWTFQVIAALCAAQGVLGLTHNDLHTNNIVYDTTDQPWLFYTCRDGTVWRVPTYGRIFKIIDFGRAIFRVSDSWFISDDYGPGGDADGQYNFGDLLTEKTKDLPIVYPNASFDLCRYSVSIIDALYPTMPPEKPDGLILSKEEGWIVRESESPLWNLLWSWLIDDEGRNILQDQDGTERFPDFDLYQHISSHIFSAKPQEQLRKDIFKEFIVEASTIGDWETKYPLFC